MTETANAAREALEAQWEQWWHGTKYCQVVNIGYTDDNLRLASFESYREGYEHALETIAKEQLGDDEIPSGAIINGRGFMDQLEMNYKFTDEIGHPLVNCAAWHEVRRCFEHMALHIQTRPAAPASVPDGFVLNEYDAGLLNDWGGGNTEWWQDYIRAELGRAHDFYQSQIAAARKEGEATASNL